MFSNMKIGIRLTLGFSVIVVLMLAMAFYSCSGLGKMHFLTDRIVNGVYARSEAASEAFNQMQKVIKSVDMIVMLKDHSAQEKEKEKIANKYEIGDEVEGAITGVVDFGAFVKLEEGLEGLIHISEIDWGLVDDPRNFVKVGQKIKAKVIEIKDGKISLSLKQLKANPWTEASKKYKKDMPVSGVIIKFNKHGALASIEEGVAGLVHVSEFGSEEKLRKALELGKTYDFKISLFDAKEQKMALTYAGVK